MTSNNKTKYMVLIVLVLKWVKLFKQIEVLLVVIKIKCFEETA